MNQGVKSPFKSIEEFSVLPPPDITKQNLGHGSYGVVKLATNKNNNQKYALKIVDCKKLRGATELDIIHREIKIHSQIEHPNIIRFHGTFKENDTITMVLEYAENGNLYNYLKKHSKLSEKEAFIYFYQTVKAIDHLHKKDILHRDIKPENLLLDSNNCIKLCDFGWSTDQIKLKRTTFCGTYEYMSPEVVFKKPYSENIDVWSLGVLLYELLQGKSPFKARNLSEIASKLKKPIELYFNENLSEEVKNLIKGILRLEASERLSLKEIFDHSWVKRMYAETDFENYEQRMRINAMRKNIAKSNSYKELEKPAKPVKQKSFMYCKVNLESEEKPFQTTAFAAANKENCGEHKTLYSFQAMKDNNSKETPSKTKNFYEKENLEISRRKIFETRNRKESPNRILKSMENLIMEFEVKLQTEKEYITSALFKKKYEDIK